MTAEEVKLLSVFLFKAALGVHQDATILPFFSSTKARSGMKSGYFRIMWTKACGRKAAVFQTAHSDKNIQAEACRYIIA